MAILHTFDPVIAGIVLCLVFNVIAVIVCWIKGGGKLFFHGRGFEF